MKVNSDTRWALEYTQGCQEVKVCYECLYQFAISTLAGEEADDEKVYPLPIP